MRKSLSGTDWQRLFVLEREVQILNHKIDEDVSGNNQLVVIRDYLNSEWEELEHIRKNQYNKLFKTS